MDPPHAIPRLARLAQPLPLWRVAPAFPHLVVLMVDAGTPPELPPGLREEYLAGMRAQLGLLATIADRLTAAGNDREALAMLQRETHKIHGSAGSYGFAEASRLAAGLEATAKDWVARPDDPEVDRGSLLHWFVGRLAEMLGITVSRAAAPAPPAAAPPPAPLPPAGPPAPPRGPPARGREEPAHPAASAPELPGIIRPEPVAEEPAAPTLPPPAPPVQPPTEAPPVGPPASAAPAPEPPAPAPAPVSAPAPTPAEAPLAVTSQAPAAATEPAAVAMDPPATSLPATTAPAVEPTNVPELMVVEDDASLAELLAYGLQARGYRFRAYRNGRDALRELIALDVQGTHPLVLLDVDLPGLDGYSVLDALQRARPGTYRIVFTTVHGT